MGFIYQVTNDINGKIYVGKTEDYPPEKRWKEHLHDYKKPRCEKRPFYDAMKLYGPEHFHFQVIEETEDTCEREVYWINKLRTYIGFEDCNGYNGTLGGDGKKYLKLNEDEVVRYHIEEAKLIAGRTAKYFNVDNLTIKNILVKHNVGWATSGEASAIMAFEKHGFIYQVDCDTNLIVNKFLSIGLISNVGGDFNSKSLKEIVNGRKLKDGSVSHYYKGYYWYSDKNLPDEIRESNNI